MLEHIPPTDSIGEIGETRAAQLQALDDATLEPGVYIEQIGSFTEAESVQENFTVVVDNSIPATTTNPAADIPLPLPDVARDASTSPIAAGPRETEAGIPGPIPGPDGNIPGDSEFAGPQEARALGEEPTLVEKTADEPRGPAIQEGVSGEIPRAEVPVSEGEARIEPGKLPEEAVPLTGIGKQGGTTAGQPFGPGSPINFQEPKVFTGMGESSGGTPVIIGNVPGHSGQHFGDTGTNTNPFGVPAIPTSGGPSSSGSGFPGGIGATGVGEGWLDYVFDFFAAGKDVNDCREAANRAQDVLKFQDAAGTDVWSWKAQADVTCYVYGKEGGATLRMEFDVTRSSISERARWVRQEPDDSNPTPYTGGRMEPPGYRPPSDDDTPRVLLRVTNDGMGDVTWKVDPDTADDTGRFYGGIMGGPHKVYPDSGGARPIDPVRDQADSSSAASKEDTGTTAETESKE